MNDRYESPFSTRYASEYMLNLFSADTRYQTWRKLWLALAKEEKALGLSITDDQINEMSAHITDIDYELVRKREKEVRHDVMAHIYAFGKAAPSAAGIIHLGATSCYVTDNADLILYRDALIYIRSELLSVIKNLSEFAEQYKETPTLGYTHYQPAQLVTIGKRASLWIQDFLSDLEEIDFALRQIRFLGCRGTTGTEASFLDLFAGDTKKIDTMNASLAADFGFSECFDVVVSESNGEYTRFIFHSLPWVFLYILVCFFGMFFFPIASFVFGKVDFKYLTFGALCFFWGLFMIAQNISRYLNLWISDPTVCSLIISITNYLFVLSMLVYMKANLGRSITRAIANGVNSVYLLLIIAVIILHLTNVADVYVTFPNMMLATAVCGIILPILLLIETRTNPQALYVLISWIPIALSIAIDTIDHYHPFANIDFYIIGLGFTMIYQIIRLVFDLKRQYKETIRYQKMQKELYEAKVSVMVSQIQPHFMYNALSSIAMLCKLDPDTAYNATITFSDYLRCNMDSLKQKTPVPFEKELEHLKKYLYIEQLRFGKKLNIVYDIKTTDFVLPQLSIQPLVENAVKHGVGMKKKGGTVTIATNETDEYYEVIISDDGVGFDTEQKKDDGRSHVGMENTRKRLKDLCGADVIITSVVGEGTVATVMLPKEEQNNENTVR